MVERILILEEIKSLYDTKVYHVIIPLTITAWIYDVSSVVQQFSNKIWIWVLLGIFIVVYVKFIDSFESMRSGLVIGHLKNNKRTYVNLLPDNIKSISVYAGLNIFILIGIVALLSHFNQNIVSLPIFRLLFLLVGMWCIVVQIELFSVLNVDRCIRKMQINKSIAVNL